MANNGNIFDYLEWRGDLSLHQSAFNAVDGLILSTISYVDFSNIPCGIKLSHLASEIGKLPAEDLIKSILDTTKTIELINCVSNSRRFKSITVIDYIDIFDEEKETQFAAVTFELPDKTLFIAFRGTDKTLVGWKEDFNMAIMTATPAQIKAAQYAAEIAEKYSGFRIRIGGHSKGGNLSVWAAAHLPQKSKERLIYIYNNDGPGFTSDFLKSSDYLSIEHKILSFVPESSVVGVLMGACDYLIIKSSNVNIFQHDPYSWLVSGKHFVYDIERSQTGKLLENKLNGVIHQLSKDELEKVFEDIYSLFKTSGIKTLDDINKHTFNFLLMLPKIIRNVEKLRRATKA